jgi:bisphosphoglycerate-dependent phosphoglycerate mutase
LTDIGIKQAIQAGSWIKENIGENFDRYYTSEFVRYTLVNKEKKERRRKKEKAAGCNPKQNILSHNYTCLANA